jgi:hypothetical protein
MTITEIARLRDAMKSKNPYDWIDDVIDEEEFLAILDELEKARAERDEAIAACDRHDDWREKVEAQRDAANALLREAHEALGYAIGCDIGERARHIVDTAFIRIDQHLEGTK